MATPQTETPQTVQIGGAQIHLINVVLQREVTLDEVHLEGGEIRLEAPAAPGESGKVTTGEAKARVLMSEPNLNRMLSANTPPEAPVRNLKIALLSGRMRITGQFVKSVMSLPFTIEASPRIDNGIRVSLDFQSAKIGVGMPAAIVEVIETFMNERLAQDLTESPIPIWLDEIRCEPGRVTILGKVRIAWPPPLLTAPFAASALGREIASS